MKSLWFSTVLVDEYGKQFLYLLQNVESILLDQYGKDLCSLLQPTFSTNVSEHACWKHYGSWWMWWRIAFDISWNLFFWRTLCHIINMVKDCFISYHPLFSCGAYSQHLPETGQDQDCRLSKPTQPHVLQRRPQIPRPLRRIYQDATALLLLREAHAYSGADSSTPSTLMLQAFILKEDLLAKTFIQSRLPMATRVLLAGKRRSKSPNIRCTSATHPCSSLEEPK